MKKNIEIYEDNGGYLHLCILDETGACVAVYGNWVDDYAPRGILIDAYKQMQEDPDAYQLWDGNELDDIDEDLTVEDLYKSLSEAQNGEADLIAWTDEAGKLQMEDWNKIGYAGRNALGLKEDEEDLEMNNQNLWYAYQTDADDNDWGTGTYDEDEAIKWLESNPQGRIAVIENGDDPVCVDEWYGEDFEGYRHH